MSFKESSAERPERRVFGRRQGRPLKASRQNVLESALPQLALPKDDLRGGGDIDPGIWFEVPEKPLVIEIGFGNGEHLAAMMREYPENNYIGAEPFINGMAAFLKEISSEAKGNVRVHMDDALQVIKSIRPTTVDAIYILNPDPWPKTRHHKRRIVNPDNLNAFARVIRPGGKLVMSTDVDDLAEWMLTHTFRHPAFEWSAEKLSDWTRPPPGWIETRYEQKGRAQGRRQSYLIFERIQD